MAARQRRYGQRRRPAAQARKLWRGRTDALWLVRASAAARRRRARRHASGHGRYGVRHARRQCDLFPRPQTPVPVHGHARRAVAAARPAERERSPAAAGGQASASPRRPRGGHARGCAALPVRTGTACTLFWRWVTVATYVRHARQASTCTPTSPRSRSTAAPTARRPASGPSPAPLFFVLGSPHVTLVELRLALSFRTRITTCCLARWSVLLKARPCAP